MASQLTLGMRGTLKDLESAGHTSYLATCMEPYDTIHTSSKDDWLIGLQFMKYQVCKWLQASAQFPLAAWCKSEEPSSVRTYLGGTSAHPIQTSRLISGAVACNNKSSWKTWKTWNSGPRDITRDITRDSSTVPTSPGHRHHGPEALWWCGYGRFLPRCDLCHTGDTFQQSASVSGVHTI